MVEKIKGQPHIALTTDCWKSFAKQSYVTITCHLIDQNGEYNIFLLSTTEIKERHTASNLRHHIQDVLRNWGWKLILSLQTSTAQTQMTL